MILLHIAYIVCMIALLFGNSSPSAYKILDADEVSELIDTSGKDLQIVDVRTPEEFKSEHIRSAVNVNVRDPNFAEQISMFKEDMPILAYCRSGARSESAASILASKGFKQVYSMKGGLSTWKNAGYPVE